MEDFFKPKVMYSEIVQKPQFYFDKNGQFYPEATVFIMTGEDIESLYYALHTNIVTYIFKRFYAGGGLGEEGYRSKKLSLKNCQYQNKSFLTISMQLLPSIFF